MKTGLKISRFPWLLTGIRHIIPPRCWGCRKWLHHQKKQRSYPYVCKPCLENLPWIIPEYSCFHCGQLTSEPNRKRCPLCLEDPFHFDQLWVGFRYESIIQQWILQFKFGKKEYMAPLLGRLLSLGLSQHRQLPDYEGIIPIPLHRKRLQQRGFNQALLLAYQTFSEHQFFQPNWLQRTRSTVPQTGLPIGKRISNMKDAFQATPHVEGKRVLLVDDVMTTGATLDAAAKTLKEAGATSVDGIVLARRMFNA